MCGIVSYLGFRDAYPIIIKGLKRLEYRGYDSAGMCLNNNSNLQVYKSQGKVVELEKEFKKKPIKSSIGIGHTRWATHGQPNKINAHPHFSFSKKLTIVHNGIIENYDTIRKLLEKKGFEFISDTDTEVLVNLIEYEKKVEKLSLFESVRSALKQVIGAYAIVIMEENNNDEIIVAKKGSPIVIGIEDNEYFIASDASPIVEYTKNVIYLNDDEVCSINLDLGIQIKTVSNKKITPFVQKLALSIEDIEKAGFDHFMLKEIFEQPKSIKSTLRGRITKKNKIKLSGFRDFENKILRASRITIIGCGTSWHAGLVASYFFESIARLRVDVNYASEFRYRNPILNENDVVISITQSGETADTLAAQKLAKSCGAITLAICNVVGSSIARDNEGGAYTHAGPEIGVASTKAFTTQLTLLLLLALRLGKENSTIRDADYQKMLIEIQMIPSLVAESLKINDEIVKIAKKFKDSDNFLYLGRGMNFPVALEGALKLKEISYVHAEGYPAAEMKHGPIALIDEKMPVVVIATEDQFYSKILSNAQEVKSRGGRIISLVFDEKDSISEISEHIIKVPKVNKYLSPIISVIPLQLLSYHIAVLRGCNVDQPRNLAKSVTVE
tara:strand:+ start:3325 stop:5163 length:1839 start_codon:yes stop_codon:yes gene_type:complete